MEDINKLINDGYKIMKFEREIDLLRGEEIGIVELKGLDGYRKVLSIDDNKSDDIEKVVFNYLKARY